MLVLMECAVGATVETPSVTRTKPGKGSTSLIWQTRRRLHQGMPAHLWSEAFSRFQLICWLKREWLRPLEPREEICVEYRSEAVRWASSATYTT
ncbi:hypothetical protein CYMTET_36410 [Cymbomonas tetramitiformis]|uniref:Uncharacterized protein n=1 Tax=Cymbomonas tetramitiformis TaxID=36881 RepID=A0AAE0CHD0_9CHLO|nr:hypothetical protein CYMTET_36410 [Cymbomonas tetramitiformis]